MEHLVAYPNPLSQARRQAWTEANGTILDSDKVIQTCFCAAVCQDLDHMALASGGVGRGVSTGLPEALEAPGELGLAS